MTMKKDKLEQYISEHGDEFDDLEVPINLWEKVESSIPTIEPKSKINFWKYAWRVAAAVFIFTSAWYLNDMLDSRTVTKPVAQTTNSNAENPLLNNLSDAEAYYTSQINSRQAELVQYTKDHPEIIEDLKREFLEFDKKNKELKKDLAESNADEKVVEAIIQSYRIKLEILEQILDEISKSKTSQTQHSVNL
jgi:hypothetical protein